MMPAVRGVRVRPGAIGAALVILAALLFIRLGHYSLWDDETMTALAAKGVMRTGDTSIVVDHGNFVFYRAGLLVRDFHDRSTPPLATYLTASSFFLFGTNPWAARLPFAFFGLATFALLLFWAYRAEGPFLGVFILGLVGNVSLLLYFRQCRYYGPTIFFAVALAYVYWRWEATSRTLLTLAGLSILLFASNYMSYAALYACLAVDYMVWKRREWSASWRNGVLLFGPQIIFNGAIAMVWNPFKTGFGAYTAVNHLTDRLTLFYWSWRDLNGCEFFALPVLLLAVGLGLAYRRTWMVRGGVAILVYVTIITIISPQPVPNTRFADVRYLTALIPLAVALEAGAICLLFQRRTILALGVAIAVFGTNLFNGGPLLQGGLRSTILCYANELLHPLPEPYQPTAQWINDHVPTGASIWVVPDYAAYPLMFAAPRALYAWQLAWPPRPDFAGLPAIHFMGQQPPDYLVAFGPDVRNMIRALQGWHRAPVSYREVATINVFWKDLYRPELIWRTFQPVTDFDPGSQAIYIFQRTDAPKN